MDDDVAASDRLFCPVVVDDVLYTVLLPPNFDAEKVSGLSSPAQSMNLIVKEFPFFF